VRLWVRRKRGNRKLVSSGCGQAVKEIADVYEREVRDLPCFEYRTTVVIELYRVRCPRRGARIAVCFGHSPPPGHRAAMRIAGPAN